MRESERISSYQNAMSENQRLQEGISNDIVSTKEELDSLKGKTGIKATIERSVLERENRRLEKRQERLEKQQHRINNLKNKNQKGSLYEDSEDFAKNMFKKQHDRLNSLNSENEHDNKL